MVSLFFLLFAKLTSERTVQHTGKFVFEKNKAKTMPNISPWLKLYQQALKNNTLDTIQTHDNEQKQTKNEKQLFKKC